MHKKIPAFLLFFQAILGSALYAQSPVNVTKTNSKPIFMHIMPWFDGPGTLGAGNWGYHWKMQKMDPNIIVDASTGKRQIASHYYPQIGPYDSSDPDVIDYQLLLMKLSGIDGVLIDWYGTAGNVGDIATNLRNSDSIVNRTIPSGLKFGLVIEDRFTGGDITIQRNSMLYARDNYFSKSNYIRYGAGNAPLVGIFGPDQISDGNSWNTILAGIEDIEFLPLEYQGPEVGSNMDGEYAWPYQTPNTSDHASQVENFYVNRAPSLKTAMGVLYAGFDDFYAEGEYGGVSYFNIPHNGTATLTQMMDLATQYNSNVDILQVATWNDYGEGTMFEPTFEFGYSFLVKLQQFTGVSYTEDDLKQVTRYYNLKKQYAGNATIKAKLDQVYKYFAALQIHDAVNLMCTIDGIGACTATPSIRITASGSPAEGGGNGTFTVTGSDLTGNTTVNYTIGGTASTADYTASPSLNGSVVLTVAQPSLNITITAIDDQVFEGDETLVVSLSSNAGYTLTQASASLTIADNDPRPCAAPVISYTASAPVIDQTIDNLWLKAPVQNINKVSYGAAPSDASGTQWRAMYDDTYLYFLIEVKDNALFNDSGSSWWEDDAVELFVDGDNNKGSAYDGVNDFQLAFRYNDATAHTGSGNMNISGVSFSQQTALNGYNIEVRIPWSALNTTPFIGKAIGLEVSVDDDDNGGMRDAQISSFSTTGTAYNDPSVFGTVYTTTCEEVIPAPVITSALSASILAGESFTYTITADNNPNNFNALNLPLGLSINSSTGVISGMVSSIGTYEITLSASNNTGTDTQTLTLQVTTVTGIHTNQNQAFVLAPNPFNGGVLHVNVPDWEGEVTVEITSVHGVKVYSTLFELQDNTMQLNALNLSKGIYVISVSKTDKVLVQRLIVE